MTVCIAALCNVGPDRKPMVVTAADRMITIDGIGYEPNQTKTIVLASQTVVLTAGDMQLHAAVYPEVTKRIAKAFKEAEEEKPEISVAEIADFYATEFSLYLRKKAEREILSPLNLTYEKYYRTASIMPHYQVREIDDMLRHYHIESSAIVAGLDSTGGHIYKIKSPGVADCMDTPFFACAGAGESLASVQFMLARYDKTWPATHALYLIYSAKARAEPATTVGKATDIAVISPGDIFQLKPSQIKDIDDILRRNMAREAEANAAAFDEVTELIRQAASRQEEKQSASKQTEVALPDRLPDRLPSGNASNAGDGSTA